MLVMLVMPVMKSFSILTIGGLRMTPSFVDYKEFF
jgi:hypothetical protein